MLKKIKLILVGLIFLSSISICFAQNSFRNKHNLGLFNDIASDTISDGIGRIYGQTDHLKFVLHNATEEPVLGDNRKSVGADFDNDGDIDLLMGSTNSYQFSSSFLVNNGDGYFTLSTNSGLPPHIKQLTCGDINNDGFSDLILIGSETYNPDGKTHSKIMRREKVKQINKPWSYKTYCMINNGDGTFSNQQTSFINFFSSNLPNQMALSDINCDGRLDLVAIRYNEGVNRLFTWLNSEQGFQQNNNIQLPQSPDRDVPKTSGGIFSIFDINNDHFPDLLYHTQPSHFGLTTTTFQLINQNGNFSEAELSNYPVDPKLASLLQLDIDNDLDFDAICTMSDAHGSRTPLYLNENGSFRNIGEEAGLWLGYTVCSSFTAGDFDNDSFLDLIPSIHGSYNVQAEIQLFKNLGNNTFATSFEAFEPELQARSFGIMFADLDGDFDLDIVIPQSHPYYDMDSSDTSNIMIYRNDSDVGNAIMFDLRGTTSNRDAIGAKITVQADDLAMVRLIEKPPFVVHFGIGNYTKIEKVQVVWPSGLIESWDNMLANKTWVLIEGSTETDQ